MAVDLRSQGEPSVAVVVQGIINDAQELMKQQFALMRAEIKEEVRKFKEAAISLALGIFLLIPGCFMLCMTLPHLLNWAWPVLPLWACYLIVGGIVVIVGVILLYVGARKIQSMNPLASQTVAALKENVQWTTNPR
jgi:hypothetical protein